MVAVSWECGTRRACQDEHGAVPAEAYIGAVLAGVIALVILALVMAQLARWV